ncbi:hypothetical protein WA026_020696 [Henosepilachna vigintioctopunctata]|uniref:Uncharacterized protein n=1 Tax=Henosepilachna vigintioctopunctata TaxID=420089 RepID=A0AAW1U300_9CUCU
MPIKKELESLQKAIMKFLKLLSLEDTIDSDSRNDEEYDEHEYRCLKPNCKVRSKTSKTPLNFHEEVQPHGKVANPVHETFLPIQHARQCESNLYVTYCRILTILFT